jgi:rhodanese-related sulfurtransferase
MMNDLFQKIALLWCLLVGVLLPSSCAQQPIPENRPACSNANFDQKVANTIRFTVPLIGVQELKNSTRDILIFDTREWEEYQVSRIPGARYLGYKDFQVEMLENLPKDTPIALYCSIGYRSEKIGEKLQKMGFTKVFNVYGSIFEWANQGYPLEDEKGNRTQRIHTYNQRWSQWVDSNRIEKIW